MLVTSALMLGCGSASKEDVCGGCTGDTKAACESLYDACKDDGDCIDALDDTNFCG
jgi:hypothetical protein